MAFKLNSDAGHVVTLVMQLAEGSSINCEIYSLHLDYMTIQNIFIYPYFKDNIIYRLPFISYAISTYILNSVLLL